MIEFEVKSRKMTIGKNKGKTMYYAVPKVSKQHLTSYQLENEIIAATSLTRGDVRNALTSLAETVNRALSRGDSVDLGDLGMLKVIVNPVYKEKEEEVTASALKGPIVRFYPKLGMRQAYKSVQIRVTNPKAHTAGGGATPPASGGGGEAPDPAG
ncbi:putative DNA-binding protein [Bacteroides pyogenes F0041]|uniref:Putative DNA-binding protein n=1 Tax=Bacteroides pyogenes F0041 TaxID=1321819 RepID=U2DYT6_9BACE|nr:HU family DNA-binding protein [Bacteroides pyogenes]ERI86872.1 putative DNA-binding protein [Bacteroides pyogenes F0041]MBB3896035.1 putative histone-like DNA-binding protein [Bacteroides pyogenes]SUV34317.1 DNA-binding protein, histone-like, putative [Bacteroides pyogenes]